ncbi:MAG TPA: molybdenum cofactor biosynthesis protein MoaE [Flavobacteriales bacterium]|nr:molybdenum cofactor biosynthesis protein MoaE [Flavobacteriales bacterium]HMR27308.1 molybdenum cofactor biosynthesis protein MoaE [Flavobacteriales bacterium]
MDTEAARSPHKKRDIFVEGPIDPAFIATSIARHATRTDIGAHEIFLGQVRADRVAGADDHPSGRSVTAIEYTAYRDMALERMTAIREEAFAQWPSMTCLHVHHSLGTIKAGELCFMVFASAPHRAAAREAVAWVVDRIKAELPIFGKEIVEGGGHIWKSNG